MILFRPIGLAELKLIAQSNWKAFPPRLPDQPIFYPVLNSTYAEQIARDWNTKEPPYAGFVTQFEIPDTFATRYPVQTVGSSIYQELWVPAEELAEFNSQITGLIVVISQFYGPQFQGEIDRETGLPSNLTQS